MKTLQIQRQSNNFFILDKTFLHDENLSWGAKGLYAYLLSLTTSAEIDDDFLQNLYLIHKDEAHAFFVELDRVGYLIDHKLNLDGFVN